MGHLPSPSLSPLNSLPTTHVSLGRPDYAKLPLIELLTYTFKSPHTPSSHIHTTNLHTLTCLVSILSSVSAVIWSSLSGCLHTAHLFRPHPFSQSVSQLLVLITVEVVLTLFHLCFSLLHWVFSLGTLLQHYFCLTVVLLVSPLVDALVEALPAQEHQELEAHGIHVCFFHSNAGFTEPDHASLTCQRILPVGHILTTGLPRTHHHLHRCCNTQKSSRGSEEHLKKITQQGETSAYFFAESSPRKENCQGEKKKTLEVQFP
ncbi:hypothetical protein E2C01_008961 [Portunus trituberculatus]|uniref:Uncharacterized protein n=1 Tax=Portunus trituberculatus TaxID=210409 RepID=A0A5B7D489_PORTR|nr:hypothetical protein [Portunus trituberculatus]